MPDPTADPTAHPTAHPTAGAPHGAAAPHPHRSPPGRSIRRQRATPHQRATLLVASIASFMVGLDALVVTTALPTIHIALHASAATLGWTVTAYSLAFAALILTGSALGERYGRRRVFLTGMAVFTLASAACALAPSVGLLIAARAAQGAGGGLAVPLTLVLITEAYPPARRGAVIGVWGALTGLAVGIGPLVGGVIVQGLAWPWVFWVNVPIGLALVLLGRRWLGESHGPARRLDPVGLVLAAAAVISLVDALLRGPQIGWASAEVAILLGAAAVLGLAFWGWERRSSAPMLPLGMFTHRGLVAALGARAARAASLFGGAFLVPQYLQLARGDSPLTVGLALLPWTAPIVAIAPRAGRLADRLGERRLITTGLAAQAVAFGLLALATTSTAGYPTLLGPLLLAGIGSGLAFPTTASAALRAAPPAQVGIASGVSATAQQLGGVLGVATAVAVFTSAGSYTSPTSITAGLHPALLALAALAALGAAAALAIPITSAAVAPLADAAPTTPTAAAALPAASPAASTAS